MLVFEICKICPQQVDLGAHECDHRGRGKGRCSAHQQQTDRRFGCDRERGSNHAEHQADSGESDRGDSKIKDESPILTTRPGRQPYGGQKEHHSEQASPRNRRQHYSAGRQKVGSADRPTENVTTAVRVGRLHGQRQHDQPGGKKSLADGVRGTNPEHPGEADGGTEANHKPCHPRSPPLPLRQYPTDRAEDQGCGHGDTNHPGERPRRDGRDQHSPLARDSDIERILPIMAEIT